MGNRVYGERIYTKSLVDQPRKTWTELVIELLEKERLGFGAARRKVHDRNEGSIGMRSEAWRRRGGWGTTDGQEGRWRVKMGRGSWRARRDLGRQIVLRKG